jgi:hypothetical protein
VIAIKQISKDHSYIVNDKGDWLATTTNELAEIVRKAIDDAGIDPSANRGPLQCNNETEK